MKNNLKNLSFVKVLVHVIPTQFKDIIKLLCYFKITSIIKVQVNLNLVRIKNTLKHNICLKSCQKFKR